MARNIRYNAEEALEQLFADHDSGDDFDLDSSIHSFSSIDYDSDSDTMDDSLDLDDDAPDLTHEQGNVSVDSGGESDAGNASKRPRRRQSPSPERRPILVDEEPFDEEAVDEEEAIDVEEADSDGVDKEPSDTNTTSHHGRDRVRRGARVRGGTIRRPGHPRVRGGRVRRGPHVRGCGIRGRGGPVRGQRGRPRVRRPMPGRAQNPRINWDIDLNDRFEPRQIPFVGDERLKIRIGANAPIEEFFAQYFTDYIFMHIVQETNRYAKQFIDANRDTLKEHSRIHKWVNTTVPEMKTFFGLLGLMGIIHKPRLDMYWSMDNMMQTPIFGQIMRRDRFFLLLKFLHFANNEDPAHDPTDPNRDRLYKIRPFIRMVRERMRGVYSPCKELCVDESLLLFKGRLLFKQCIRTKRARFGIKFFELCTSEGICLDFIVYSAENIFRDHPDPRPEMLVTERIPINLMQPYLERGHTLYVDNYYTSPALATYLLDHDTYICGTVNPKCANYPSDLGTKPLEKGTSCFMKSQAENMLAVKFRALKNKSNNKPKEVCMLTTEGRAIMIPTGKLDKDNNPIQKPTCIIEYNRNMGGVDMVDQQIHSVSIVRKTYKWYKKIALRLFMQCALSAHKLHRKFTSSTKDFLADFKDLLTVLVCSSPKLNKPVASIETVHRLTGKHFPVKREEKHGSSNRKDKMCRVCWARGLRTTTGKEIRTVWICPDCPSNPGLHANKDCFRVYHSQLDYSTQSDE